MALLTHAVFLRAIWRLMSGWLVFLLVTCPSAMPHAQEPVELDESQVIAQMIVNFPMVTSWPASSASPDGKIAICSVTNTRISRDVEALISASQVSQKYQFYPDVPVEALPACHMLILAEDDTKLQQKALQRVQNAPVLTVGTSTQFARKGGVIGFVKSEKNLGVFSDHKVRFEVNLKHARHIGLQLDPLLLELADTIVSE